MDMLGQLRETLPSLAENGIEQLYPADRNIGAWYQCFYRLD
jgi:hypothetical protein